MEKDGKYDTGNRLSRIVDEKYDGNASALARDIDMNPTTFYKYTSGDRRPGPSVLVRLTDLGINLHWLLTGEGPALRARSDRFPPLPIEEKMKPEVIEGPEEPLHRVPLVQVEIGDDGPYLKEVGSAEWLTESFVRDVYGIDPGRLKGFRVSGNAMKESLRAGDRTRGVLWRGESLTDGAIYVLYSEPGGIVYRRIRFERESVRLVADHPDVEDRSVAADTWHERFRPVAHVLELVRAL
jgi:hypothetical protein